MSQRVEESDGDVVHDMMQTNVRLAPDATGSPLIDSSGTVVGIVTRRGTDDPTHPTATPAATELEVRYATPIEWAKRVADEMIDYRSRPPGVARRARGQPHRRRDRGTRVAVVRRS